jgi:hypothetical protein
MMSLFFTHEEILNTASAELQALVVWQTPPGQGDLILKRGDYLLPSAFQAIEWDFLPDHINTWRTFGVPISGHWQGQALRLDAADKRWLRFRDEAELRAWAVAYGIALPDVQQGVDFTLDLPKGDLQVLPLEILKRCKGVRMLGERAYRCHLEAFHGGHCRFIAHHKEG